MKKSLYLLTSMFFLIAISGCQHDEILIEHRNPDIHQDVIRENKQWLINNSPFYLIRGFDYEYTTLINDNNYGYPSALVYVNDDGSTVESYMMSLSFIDSSRFQIRECRMGELHVESGSYDLRFSFYPEGGSGENDFLSTILSFEGVSNTIFSDQLLKIKEQTEEVINNTYPSIISRFFIGGRNNTYEINLRRPGIDFSVNQPQNLSIYQLSPTSYDWTYANRTEINIDSDLLFYPYFSYIDEWGYPKLGFDGRPLNYTTFKSVNSDFFSTFADSLATDFSCLDGELPTDDCNIPCVNGTVVEEFNGEPCYCDCEEGWTGPSCDEPISVRLSPYIHLLAGDGNSGFTDGTFGQVSYPQAVAYSQTEARIYFTSQRSIRSVDPNTNDLQTLIPNNPAGYIDGAFNVARFGSLGDIVVDQQGIIYVTDPVNNVVRMIANGEVSTYAGIGAGDFADGLASEAEFNNPYGLAIKDDTLFVADQRNRRIRAISMSDNPSERYVSTYAGNGSNINFDGPNENAGFYGPWDIDYDEVNQRFIVVDISDSFSHAIRSVSATETSSLTISVPGNWYLNRPAGVVCDLDGSFYLSDQQGHMVYHMTDIGGVFAAQGVAGQFQTPGFNGGPFGSSQLNRPNLMTFAPVYNSEEDITRQSLIITCMLGHSLWYMPVR